MVGCKNTDWAIVPNGGSSRLLTQVVDQTGTLLITVGSLDNSPIEFDIVVTNLIVAMYDAVPRLLNRSDVVEKAWIKTIEERQDAESKLAVAKEKIYNLEKELAEVKQQNQTVRGQANELSYKLETALDQQNKFWNRK